MLTSCDVRLIAFVTESEVNFCRTERTSNMEVKVKCSRYRPGVTQRVGRGIALLFHDHGTRRGRVVSSTPRPHFTPGKDPVHIVQEAGRAPGPVWTGGKSRPHRDSIPDRPAPSQSLYRLSYPVHKMEEKLHLSRSASVNLSTSCTNLGSLESPYKTERELQTSHIRAGVNFWNL
jgi:hypothetical protein